MIRVTIELISAVDESRSRKLAVMIITNDGTGTATKGNYIAGLVGEYTKGKARCARLVDFNRKNNSVWSLVGAFLKHFGHTKHSPLLIEKMPDEDWKNGRAKTGGAA